MPGDTNVSDVAPRSVQFHNSNGVDTYFFKCHEDISKYFIHQNLNFICNSFLSGNLAMSRSYNNSLTRLTLMPYLATYSITSYFDFRIRSAL